MATAKDKRGKARKTKRKLDSVGIAHVKSSFNNTLITMTDLQGNVITWSSGGHQGRYKGSRKSTAFAAQLAARFCADALNESYFGWDQTRFPTASAHNQATAAMPKVDSTISGAALSGSR